MFTTWTKSSYSAAGSGGTCVEVAHNPTDGVTGVRDSKHRAGGHLVVSRRDWHGFLAAIT